MAKLDIYTRELMRRSDVFAEAFNFLLFNNKQFIRPENLRECDTKLIHTAKTRHRQNAFLRERDVIKQFFQDDEHIYLMLGIENQASIDYLMPLRIMLYDALSYEYQINNSKLQKFLQSNGKTNSGRRQRLLPVITLVCNFGLNKWTGPTTLHELMGDQDPILMKLVADYPIFLLDPHQLSRKKLKNLKSELGCILECIKHNKNRAAVSNLLNSDERFKSMSRNAANIINTQLHLNLQISSHKKDKFNMCQAIQEMKEIAEKRGQKIGEKIGEKTGTEKTQLRIAKQLIKKTDMTNKAIASITGLKLDVVNQLTSE